MNLLSFQHVQCIFSDMVQALAAPYEPSDGSKRSVAWLKLKGDYNHIYMYRYVSISCYII